MSVIIESKIEFIAIHCSATPVDMDVNAEMINDWHKKRGWTEIGYHFVIKRDGYIEIGRDLDTPGAHVKGFNSKSWGVCIVGGVDAEGKPEDNFTGTQYDSLYNIIATLKLIAYNAQVKGHNEFPGVNKACPCFNVQDWLNENFY